MTTDNPNMIYSDKYRMVFTQIPGVVLMGRNVNLPDISQDSFEIANANNYISVPSSKVRYGDMNLTFKVDEDLNNYNEIYKWIIGMGAPQNFEQFSSFQKGFRPNEIGKNNGFQYSSDATIVFLTNVFNPNVSVLFRNIRPTSLSGLDLTTVSTQTIEATVSFKFDYFELILKK